MTPVWRDEDSTASAGSISTTNEQLELIGRRIQRRRLDLCMTQQQFAIRAGVSQQTISHIESGSRLNISIGVVIAVCHRLDLELRPVPWFYLSVLDDRLEE